MYVEDFRLITYVIFFSFFSQAFSWNWLLKPLKVWEMVVRNRGTTEIRFSPFTVHVTRMKLLDKKKRVEKLVHDDESFGIYGIRLGNLHYRPAYKYSYPRK